MANPVDILLVLAGYLLGSVSFAHLFAVSKGLDLRAIGSGNLGATNAARCLGSGYGLAVYCLDAAKGAIPVLCASLWMQAAANSWLPALCGFAAVVGHVWPIWHRFRGGKGVATLTGAMFVLQPVAALSAAGVAFVVAKLSGFISLASLVYGIALLIASWFLSDATPPLLSFSGIAMILVFFTHRSNIKRLWGGTESRVGDSV